jgi:hypothetical protein
LLLLLLLLFVVVVGGVVVFIFYFFFRFCWRWWLCRGGDGVGVLMRCGAPPFPFAHDCASAFSAFLFLRLLCFSALLAALSLSARFAFAGRGTW